MPILELQEVSIRFGGLLAVNRVSLQIVPGEILALIGPNGAGKSTIFNLITGLYNTSAGRIFFQDRIITGKKPYSIAAMGVARTFQTIHLFNDLTVLDNVLIGAHCQGKTGLGGALIGFTPWVRNEEKKLRRWAFQCLDRVNLAEKSLELAKNLAYGEQRRLEIARALALKPLLLLLDEPAAGMNPMEKKDLMGLIHSLRDSGITIFLVEHDMKFVMGISDRIVVLDYGSKIAEGTPEEIRNDSRVIEAYLGRSVNR
ncbi:MAG: ABC transporter ATP-binding protein [Bacillota bacterium]